MRIASVRSAHQLTRALALGGACAVAGSLALSTPAEADAAAFSIQDDRLASEPLAGIPARIALLKESQTKVTRIDVLWSLVAPTKPADATDPDDPAYDFSRIDAIVLGLKDAGITPLFTIFSAPSWAAPGDFNPINSEVNPNTPQAADVANFYEAVAERYSGDFEQVDGTVLPEVRHFEVWNEPNIAGFLSPQVMNGKRVAFTNYLEFVRQAYPAIKRSNGRAIVIAGVGGPRSSTDDEGTGALKWLQDVASSNVPFDAYSQHIYPAAAPTKDTPAVPAWATLPQLIDELDQVPRRKGMPIFVTEAGYTTAATPVPHGQGDARPSRPPTWSRSRSSTSSRRTAFRWSCGSTSRTTSTGPAGSTPRRWSSSRAIRSSQARRGEHDPGELHAQGQRRERPPHLPAAADQSANLPGGGPPGELRASAARRVASTPTTSARAGSSGPRSTPASCSRAPRTWSRRKKLGRTLTVPAGTPGDASKVRLARVSCGSTRRSRRRRSAASNGLAARLGGSLTGGDITAATLPVSQDRRGAHAQLRDRAGHGTRRLDDPVADGGSGGGTVKLSAAQLLINQRIAQAAVRRSNALIEELADGLTTSNFAAGTVTATDLAPTG